MAPSHLPGDILYTASVLAIKPKTGEIARQFQTSSGINAQPITFTHKGRQYVSVQVGLGGVNVLRMGDALRNIPRGGSVWTFGLMED